MSRADELKAAVRASQAPKPAPAARDVEPEPAPARETPRAAPAVATPSTARVRRTVDLGPADHHALAAWCAQAAGELGRARVTGQDVLSALVARLVRDDELSEAIVRDLRAGQ